MQWRENPHSNLHFQGAWERPAWRIPNHTVVCPGSAFPSPHLQGRDGNNSSSSLLIHPKFFPFYCVIPVSTQTCCYFPHINIMFVGFTLLLLPTYFFIAFHSNTFGKAWFYSLSPVFLFLFLPLDPSQALAPTTLRKSSGLMTSTWPNPAITSRSFSYLMDQKYLIELIAPSSLKQLIWPLGHSRGSFPFVLGLCLQNSSLSWCSHPILGFKHPLYMDNIGTGALDSYIRECIYNSDSSTALLGSAINVLPQTYVPNLNLELLSPNMVPTAFLNIMTIAVANIYLGLTMCWALFEELCIRKNFI